MVPVCGDGVVEAPEECDDARNGNWSDGCTDACLFSCHAYVWEECQDMMDDCVQSRCVPGGFGQVCVTSRFDGQCPHGGCMDGGRNIGHCQDGFCVCSTLEPGADGGVDAGGGADADADAGSSDDDAGDADLDVGDAEGDDG